PTYVAPALARSGLAYLHAIERRVAGNVSDDETPPVAFGSTEATSEKAGSSLPENRRPFPHACIARTCVPRERARRARGDLVGGAFHAGVLHAPDGPGLRLRLRLAVVVPVGVRTRLLLAQIERKRPGGQKHRNGIAEKAAARLIGVDGLRRWRL